MGRIHGSSNGKKRKMMEKANKSSKIRMEFEEEKKKVRKGPQTTMVNITHQIERILYIILKRIH